MQVSFRISEQDYVRALLLHEPVIRAKALVYLGALFLLAVLLFQQVTGIALIAIVVGAGIRILIQRYVWLPFYGRRSYRKYPLIQDEVSIELQDEGIRLRSAQRDGVLPWQKFLKWRHNDEFILIYLMPRLFYIVPKRLADAGLEIDHLIRQLASHVGKPV